MSLRPALPHAHILHEAMYVGARQTSRNTKIGVRISIQLHFDYREYRPCATDPVEAHILPISLHALPSGRSRGWSRRGLRFWCRASTRLGNRSWGYSPRLRRARLADRFWCWFRLWTAAATTDGNIEVDSRPVKVVTSGLCKSWREGTRIPREERDQRGFASVYMCAGMSNTWPILLVEGLTDCRCSCRSQKLGDREERWSLEEVPLSNMAPYGPAIFSKCKSQRKACSPRGYHQHSGSHCPLSLISCDGYHHHNEL